MAACKASNKNLESSPESVGFNTKALLFHKRGDSLTPRNDYRLPGSSKSDLYEFLICDKLKTNLAKDVRKANINLNSCKNAFTRKNGDGSDLLLQVNVIEGYNLRDLKFKAELSSFFHGALDSFLGLTSIATIAVFSVAGGTAGGIAGGAAGGTGGSVVPVVGTAAGAVSGGIGGAVVGYAQGALIGMAVSATIGVIKGRTTHRWKQADQTTLKYFKDIFNLDNGGKYQEVSRARDIRFILLWISDHFDAKLKPQFVRLGEGDPTDFD
jgi:hypothetical protein